MQCPRSFWILLVSTSLGPIACAHGPRQVEPAANTSASPAKEHVLTLVSDTLRIEGPYHQVQFTIGPATGSEIVWITAMSADVVKPDMSPLPVEFFCHANLDYDPTAHSQLFNTRRVSSPRLFTLSQGHEVMRFPDG